MPTIRHIHYTEVFWTIDEINALQDSGVNCSECGHPLYRHIDPYEDGKEVGCKYCRCGVRVPLNILDFVDAINHTTTKGDNSTDQVINSVSQLIAETREAYERWETDDMPREVDRGMIRKIPVLLGALELLTNNKSKEKTMGIPADKIIHEISGEGGNKIQFGKTDDGKVVVKSSDATVVVSKEAIQEAGKKLSNIP